MDELFIGSAICKVSKRGDLLLPATFRRAARIRAGVPEVRLFVDRREGSDCLTVFDRACIAHDFVDDGSAMSDADAGEAARTAALRRRYAFAVTIEMQPHGLITLPPIVRSRLKIRDNVLLVAIGHAFEIWDVQFVLEWGDNDLVTLVQLHRNTPRIDGDCHEPRLPVRRTQRHLTLAAQSGVSVQPLQAVQA